MPRPPPFLALFLAALSLASAAPARGQEGDTILPGWWSYETHALALYNKSERRCVRPREIDRFMSGAINHHLFCDSPFRNRSFGPVEIRGVCRDKHGNSFPVSMSGDFSATRLSMNVRVAGFLPVEVQARRLSPTCPAAGQS